MNKGSKIKKSQNSQVESFDENITSIFFFVLQTGKRHH